MEVKVNIIDTLFTTIPKNTVVASYTIDEDSVDLTMLNDQYSFNTANKTILTSSNVTSNNLKAINFTARNWVSGEQVEINDMYPRVVSKLQNKFNKPNVIYKITKDYDLNHCILTIPEGCTLQFEGGSLDNGILQGTNTNIENKSNSYIFKSNLFTLGGLTLEELDIRWFGAKSDYKSGTGTDCSPAIQKALEWSQYFYGIYLGIHGKFYLGTPIVTTADLNLKGDRVPGKILFTEADGNPDQSVTSTIYVKAGITAFTLKGFGDTAKLIKFNLENIKFTSAWGISDDNTEWVGEHTILLSSDTIGGPSRPSSIIGCTINSFYRVLELDSSKINKETQLYNLDIRRNSIDKCGTIFYFRTYGAKKGSGLITIENNILEQSNHVFDIDNVFGYLKISSNLLENAGSSSIKLGNPGNLDLIGNYWEAMKGDFTITGTDYSSVVKINQNSGGYIQATPSSPYRIILSEVTLLDYDLYNMGDIILRRVIHKVSPRIRLTDIPSEAYLNCAVHIPIESVNFINPSDTFKDPKYHFASRSYVENGAINKPLVKTAFIPTSEFQSVGNIKGKLNDFVYVSFYKNAGPLTIAVYTDGGIKAAYDIATAWESGYCFIVTKINQNVGDTDANLYVVPYNTNTTMNVQISNVNIVNITQASIYDYNFGDIVVTANADGSLTNKVIEVSNVNAIKYLNDRNLTDYTLKIVKDIDLGGQEITIPANCTLDFQGGSFSNGTITFSNTTIVANSSNYIFKNTIFKGSLKCSDFYVDWVGASASNEDNSDFIKQAVIVSSTFRVPIVFNSVIYNITKPIILDTLINNVTIKGNKARIQKVNSITTDITEAVPTYGGNVNINYACIFCITEGHYWTIRDLAFYGGTTEAYNNYGIFIIKGSNFLIENVGFTYCSIAMYVFGLWMSNFTKITCTDVNIGFNFNSARLNDIVGNSGTSICFNNCYVNRCNTGFNLKWLNYSVLNSCAVDYATTNAYTYADKSCVTMNGCGSEASKSWINLLSNSNVVLNACQFLSTTAENTSTVVLFNSKILFNNCAFQDYVTKAIFTNKESNITLIDTDVSITDTTLVFNISGVYYIKLENKVYIITYNGKRIENIIDYSNLLKGTTDNRPILASINEGFEYYDSTLKKKILWNGSTWTNLDGTALT